MRTRAARRTVKKASLCECALIRIFDAPCVLRRPLRVTSNGFTYSFSLKHNESIEFVVPDGCTASVSEDNYSSEGYVTTWNSGINNVVISEDKTIICTNTRDLTPTGLNNSAKPFIILLGCALLAVACFVAGKKGKFRKLG